MAANKYIKPYVEHGEKAGAVRKITVSIPLHVLRLLSDERTRRQVNNLRHATNSDLLVEAFLHAFTGQQLPQDEDLKRALVAPKPIKAVPLKKPVAKSAAKKPPARKAPVKALAKAPAKAPAKTAAVAKTSKPVAAKKLVVAKKKPTAKKSVSAVKPAAAVKTSRARVAAKSKKK